MFGVDTSRKITSYEEGYEIIKQKTQQLSPYDLDMLMLENGLCGSICYTPDEWQKTQMGRSLARHPLVNYKQMTHAPHTPAVPFPTVLMDKRPLAGVKVVELARIIAGPACGMILASMGAEVVRIQARRMIDFTVRTSLELLLARLLTFDSHVFFPLAGAAVSHGWQNNVQPRLGQARGP